MAVKFFRFQSFVLLPQSGAKERKERPLRSRKIAAGQAARDLTRFWFVNKRNGLFPLVYVFIRELPWERLLDAWLPQLVTRPDERHPSSPRINQIQSIDRTRSSSPSPEQPFSELSTRISIMAAIRN